MLKKSNLETSFILLAILKNIFQFRFLCYCTFREVWVDFKLDNQSAPVNISVTKHRQKIFEFLNYHWPLISALPPPPFLETINIWNSTINNRAWSYSSSRYTNADLKISLYVCVHIDAIPWKIHILKPENSRVICT